MKLENKVAMITGGGSGVGLATAKLFLAEGAKVAITGRDGDKLRRAADELAGGDRVLVLPGTVSDPEACRLAVEAVTAKFGRVDILVNNAGTNLKERTTRELTVEAWQTLLRTNLDGVFYSIRAVLPQMFERKDGVIVTVNSVAGKRGNPLGGPAYCASKFGLTGMISAMANEERESGVRFSSIMPGEIETPLLEHRPSPVTAEARAKILKPEDVAAAILFLATLPPHVSVPELIIKPTTHTYF